MVPVHVLVATGVNADGHREILGVQVTTSEDGAGWLAFFRDLSARGLAGVKMITSDAHRGLVSAIEATLPSGPTTPPNGSTARSGAAPTSSGLTDTPNEGINLVHHAQRT